MRDREREEDVDGQTTQHTCAVYTPRDTDWEIFALVVKEFMVDLDDDNDVGKSESARVMACTGNLRQAARATRACRERSEGVEEVRGGGANMVNNCVRN